MPDSYSRQTLKLVSIGLACCFSCSPGTSPGAGPRLRGQHVPGLRLATEHLLPAASQVPSFGCFSTKGHY